MRLAGLLFAGIAACGFEVDPVPAALAPDAAVPQIDAAPRVFDPAKCPPSFVAVAALPHRYLWGTALVATGVLIPWQTAQDRCAAMATTSDHIPHLVVPDELGERQAVWAAIGGSMGYQWIWTGLFQTGTGTWSSITGTPAAPEWAPLEPMDRSGSTTTTKRGIAYGGNDGRPPGDLHLPLDWSENAACECDGRDVVAMP
jgi:hypothetical protein